MEGSDSKEVMVDLLGTVDLLHRHLSESLCEQVFQDERERERQRKWSVYAMASFWTEVIVRAPQALTQPLQECAQGAAGWPHVEAAEASFFERSAALHPRFLAGVFDRFAASILPEAKPVFASDLDHLYNRFPDVWVIDGSKLAAIRRRLKALWNVRNVVLPGALLALYDLRRGVLRHLDYSPDAARAEITRSIEIMSRVPAGTLLAADRLFAVPKYFAAVNDRDAWIVARRNKTVKLRSPRRLSRRSYRGGTLTDMLVQVGGSNGTPKQQWRHLRWVKGKTVHELVTNVLDPKRLSAEEALDLYPKRWAVERMFYDLKEVLNLNDIYLSHPNGVAQQVYAAAMVHTALRVGQGHIAAAQELEPEQISVPKLFPRLASACATYEGVQLGIERVKKLNPEVDLVLPDLRQMDFASVPLRTILVEKRNDRRRKRKFCKSRGRWKSFAHIPGTKKLAKN